MNKKRVPRNVVKVFALCSTIGAIIKGNHNGDPRLSALELQASRAMRVFHVKAGRETYWEISNRVGKIWEEITEKYDKTIPEEQVPAYISMLCSLVSEKDFKDFLGVKPYKDVNNVELDSRVSHSILYLEEEINKIWGTKPVVVSIYRSKSKKGKVTIRDKAKIKEPVKKKISSAKIKKSQERKRKQWLRDRIAKAKEKANELD